MSTDEPTGRSVPRRPSRQERAPYTDALARAVAEGRLTDELYEQRLEAVDNAASFGHLDLLVADLPFTPPAGPARAARGRTRVGRLAVAGVVVAVLAAGLTHGILVLGGAGGLGPSGGAGSDGWSRPDAGPPVGWQPPEIAQGLEAVDPLDDASIDQALERARAAEFETVERIHLSTDGGFVTGTRADGIAYSVDLGTDNAGAVWLDPMDADEEAKHLRLEDLEYGVDAIVDAARDAGDVEDGVAVEWVSIAPGGDVLTPDSAGRNVVEVGFANDTYGAVHGDDLSPTG